MNLIQTQIIMSRLDEEDFEMTGDKKFGVWIKDQRIKNGFTVLDVSDYTRISIPRLLDLESGQGKGITHREAQLIGACYRLDADLIINHLFDTLN